MLEKGQRPHTTYKAQLKSLVKRGASERHAESDGCPEDTLLSSFAGDSAPDSVIRLKDYTVDWKEAIFTAESPFRS